MSLCLCTTNKDMFSTLLLKKDGENQTERPKRRQEEMLGLIKLRGDQADTMCMIYSWLF